jgi:indolepyruvate decarboxylase
VGTVFGVPGDYCLQLFDALEASAMQLVVTCNELNAGYAADAYARLNGIGAVAVTYDVGGFSLLNAIAGAHAERVPVIVVSGAPKTTEERSTHVLHHTTGDLDVQYNVYRNVTEAAVRLRDAAEAPEQIDAAVAAALKNHRPTYIEIPLDLVTMDCRAPGDPMSPSATESDARAVAGHASFDSDPGALHEAVEETAAMLELAAAEAGDRSAEASCAAVVMAGVEAHRLGLAGALRQLIEALDCPFVTTIHGKSVLPESHPLFAGVYIGALGRPAAHDTVEGAHVVLSLGNLMSDVDLGLYTAQIDASALVTANSDRVRIGHHVYDAVTLGDFIDGLLRRLPRGLFGWSSRAVGPGSVGPTKPAAAAPPATTACDGPSPPGSASHGAPPAAYGGASPAASYADTPAASSEPYTAVPDAPITIARFYRRVQDLIDRLGPGTNVLADAGDAFFSAAELRIPDGGNFLCQAFYTSIGWTVPATLGTKCAEPGTRAVTFVGDGAFQMTAQELSTIVRLGQDPVVFVINNGGFVIERYIHDGPYNDIQPWRYSRLAEVFGGPPGLLVRTEGDLERALEHVLAHPGELVLVEVQTGRMDASETLRRFGAHDA